MSNWQSRVIRPTALAVSIVISLAVANAGQNHTERLDRLGIAIHLLRAFYPELSGKDVTLEVRAFQPINSNRPLGVFDIQVSEVRPTEPVVPIDHPNLSSAERVGHLSTHFEFGSSGQLSYVFAKGSYVNDSRREQFVNLMNAHQEWSEKEILNALSSGGAKFVLNTKTAVQDRFPQKELEEFLGRIKISSVTFQSNSEDEDPPSRFTWLVRFSATNGRKTQNYFAEFEPFELKMVMFGEVFTNGNKHR